jgi:hypothetical protein
VTVIDTDFVVGQIYVQRFSLVAKVLSESDKKAVLEAKLRYYQEHEHNLCVLLVRQDRISAVQYDRQARASWRRGQLARPGAALTFPDIGLVGRPATFIDPRRSIRLQRYDQSSLTFLRIGQLPRPSGLQGMPSRARATPTGADDMTPMALAGAAGAANVRPGPTRRT